VFVVKGTVLLFHDGPDQIRGESSAKEKGRSPAVDFGRGQSFPQVVTLSQGPAGQLQLGKLGQSLMGRFLGQFRGDAPAPQLGGHQPAGSGTGQQSTLGVQASK